MKCPNCQSNREKRSRVCGHCGTTWNKKCPRCSRSLRSAAKFCDRCGHPLQKESKNAFIDYSQPRSYTPKFLAEKILTTRASIEGERKLVTVLFADVADYTSLAERLDPEDVHQIMNGCFRILMDEIHKCEGTINQFTGDGIMALFGAPIAHEDHAHMACFAALSIQKGLAEYGASIKKQRGLNFQMRIGLNSGPVVVGSIGDDLRMDYTAIGNTTNLASRMQTLAPSGGVNVSEHTYRLARNFFRFKSLGKIRVKGKEEPQETYELVGTWDVRTRIEAAEAKGLTRFVGRSREMGILQEIYREAKSGSGRAVEVVGEAGAGKTRLILELKKMVSGAGSFCLEGHCLHYGASIAYLPVLDILRSYFEIPEGEEPLLIRTKLREKMTQLGASGTEILPPMEDLLALSSDNETYLNLAPKEKREKIFAAVAGLFVRESRNRVLVLVFEDLHWIDKTSEDFLHFFIPWLADSRILLILLYRPEYLAPWTKTPGTREIRVEQLSAAESTALVHSILGSTQVMPEIRDLISARAAGNPLFTEELTHALLENGSIQKNGNRFLLCPAAEIQVPETIEGIIAARMDRLPDRLKSVMQVASVIGREFAFGILQSILEIKNDLSGNLADLQNLDFIYEKRLFPELEYVFKHALTQEVAYNSLLLKRRKLIHEKIGGAIEELYRGRLEEFYEMLAYHYSRSQDLERAVYFLKASGQKAMKNHSNSEAFRFYRETIRVLRQMPQTEPNKREQIEVLLLMAVPMRLLGNPDDSLHYLQEGEWLCREVGDRKSTARVYTFLGLFYSTKGDPALGRKYQEDSFQEATKIEDVDIMAPIGYGLSFSYLVEGEFRKCVKIAPPVTALLERTERKTEFFGSPGNLYSALQGHYGLSMGALGKFEDGEEACRKALSFARKIHHVFSIGSAEFHYGIFFTFKEDGKNIIRHLEKAIRCFEKSQGVYSLPSAWSMLGYGYFLLGDLGRSLQLMEKGLQLQAELGIPLFLSLHHLFLSWVRFGLGHWNEARTHAEAALEFSRTHNEKYVEGMSWVQMGRILGRTDPAQAEKAEEKILGGMRVLEELMIKPWLSLSHFFLGELWMRAGGKEKARDHTKKAERLFPQIRECRNNYNRRKESSPVRESGTITTLNV